MGNSSSSTPIQYLKGSPQSSQDASASSKRQDIRVLSYNVFMRPPGIKTNKDDFKNERLAELGRELVKYDVIGFQELFGSFSYRRERLIKNLGTSGGFLYAIHAPSPPVGVFVDGGLAILSKLPVVASDWRRYPRGMYSDSLAEKGVLYAKIAVTTPAGATDFLHVFNTHTQSSYQDAPGAKSFSVRSNQIDLLRQYIDEKTSGDSHPIIVMGDFNVDARRELPAVVDSAECVSGYTFVRKTDPAALKLPILLRYLDMMRMFRSRHYSMVDLLKLAHNGDHPVTFGDSIQHPETGATVPRETALTGSKDLCSMQRLDYLFLGLRRTESSKLTYYDSDSNEEEFEHHFDVEEPGSPHEVDSRPAAPSANSDAAPTSLGEVTSRIRIKKGSAKVAPFFVDASATKMSPGFTQLSDHYGVEVTLSLA